MLPCKAAANCVDIDSASHGSVALSIGSRRSRIHLVERTAAGGSTTAAPYGAVVSKCALRGLKASRYLPSSVFCTPNRISSSFFSKSGSRVAAFGKTLSKIAPSRISRRVRAFRSFTRFLAWASSSRCCACFSCFSVSVKMPNLSVKITVFAS